MILVDTSAVVAIINREPDANRFVRVLTAGEAIGLPASCYLEATMVLLKAYDRGVLDGFLDRHRIEIIPIDAREARLAADAFVRYGRGSGHPARLNFGDCLAYAAAVSRRAPLLCKGEDFARTDVARAL